MTEVTDKMVDAACKAFGFGSSDIPSDYMRAAIEAALVAREPANSGELVDVLTNSADAIDELAEALKIIASIDDKLFWEDWEKVEEAVRIAKSAIAKAEIKP